MDRVFEGTYDKPVAERISLGATLVTTPFAIRFTFKLSGVYRTGGAPPDRLPTPWVMRTWSGDGDQSAGAAVYTNGQCIGDLTETRIGVAGKIAGSAPIVRRADGPGIARNLSPDEWANVVVTGTALGNQTKLQLYLGETLWATMNIDGLVAFNGITFGCAPDDSESPEYIWGQLGRLVVFTAATDNEVIAKLPEWTRHASLQNVTPVATAVDRNKLGAPPGLVGGWIA